MSQRNKSYDHWKAMFLKAFVPILLFVPSLHCHPLDPCSGSRGNEVSDEPGFNLQLSYETLGYVTNISLGTPPQPFSFDVSSRTQEFWVQSSNCSRYCEREPKYNASQSTSYKEDGRRVSATWREVQGEPNGYLSSDTVTIGTSTIEDVLFGEITNVFGSFYENSNISGTLGLGFKPNPPFGFFLDDLLRFTCIHRVAGFYLKRVGPSDEMKYMKDAGHVTLGSKLGDRSLYDGDIHWVKGKETNDSDQLVPIQSITAGGKVSLCEGGCQGIIDTTSIMIALPGFDSFKLNEALGFMHWIGSGYVTKCDRMDSLPNVTFDIDGFKASIPPSDYLIELSNPYDDEKICVSRFYAMEGGTTVVLGRPFLYNAYTLFDYDQKKIGFAPFKPGANKFAD